jgi:hypothetical protein
MNDSKDIINKYTNFNKKKDHYILDENNNVIEADLTTWAQFIGDERERSIVKQEYIGDLQVSTIFIGLDHNLAGLITKGEHRPHIFETMIFKDNKDIYCDRYSTWEEAKEGHQKAIDWINNGCKEEEESDRTMSKM